MTYNDTNLELSKNEDSKIIISHVINLLTEDEDYPLTIRSTKYSGHKDIKISYCMRFEATDDYLVIYARNTFNTLRQAKKKYLGNLHKYYFYFSISNYYYK
jgi:hypothetical protein